MKKIVIILALLVGCENHEVCFTQEKPVLDELEGVPCNDFGNDGDRYLCNDNGYFIYEKISGEWIRQETTGTLVLCMDNDSSDLNDYPEMWWNFGSWVHLGIFIIEETDGLVSATVLTNYKEKPSFKLQYYNNGWKDLGHATFSDGSTVVADVQGEYDFRCVVYQDCEWYKWGNVHLVIE